MSSKTFQQEGNKRQKLKAESETPPPIGTSSDQAQSGAVGEEAESASSFAPKYDDLPLDQEAQDAISRTIDALVHKNDRSKELLQILLDTMSAEIRTSSTLERDANDIINTPTVRPNRIAACGPTGIGKSLTLSALFGIERLARSGSDGEAVTAVRVEYAWNDDFNSKYRVVFHFISKAQFAAKIAEVYDALLDGETHALDFLDSASGMIRAYSGESTQQMESLVQAVQSSQQQNPAAALQGDLVTGISPREAFIAAVLASGPEDLLGSLPSSIEYKSKKKLIHDVDQKTSTLQQPGGLWWPILSHVEVLFRHDLLERGLRIVDAPGSGDRNIARKHMSDLVRVESDACMLFTLASRASSDSRHTDAMAETVRNVYQEGRLHTIILVCNQADNVNLRNTIHNLGLKELEDLDGQVTSYKSQIAKIEAEVSQQHEESELIKDCTKDSRRWGTQLKNAKANKKINSIRNPLVKHGVPLKSPLSMDTVQKVLSKLRSMETAAERRHASLASRAASREAKLPRLRRKMAITKNNLNQRAYNAHVEHIRSSQAKLLVGLIQQQQRDHADQHEELTGQKLEIVDNDTAYWERMGKQLSPSVISAAAHLKWPDCVKEGITSQEQTGIGGLYRKLKAVNLVEQLRHNEELAIKADLVLNTLKDAVAGRDTPDSHVSWLAILKDEYCSELDRLPQLLAYEVEVATRSIRSGFKSALLDLLDKVKDRSHKQAKRAISSYVKPSADGDKSNVLKVQQLRAACAPSRKGEYTTRGVLIDFNKTVAEPIRSSASGALQGIFTGPGASKNLKSAKAMLEMSSSINAIIDKHLEGFKQLAQKLEIGTSTITRFTESAQLRKVDVSNLVRSARTRISEDHAQILNAIKDEVCKAYASGYQHAHDAAHSGKGSFDRASAALIDSLTVDGVVGIATDKFAERLQTCLEAAMQKLRLDVISAAESMKNDFFQAIRDRRQGVLNISDGKAKETLREKLDALNREDLTANDLGSEDNAPEEESDDDVEDDEDRDTGASASEHDETNVREEEGADSENEYDRPDDSEDEEDGERMKRRRKYISRKENRSSDGSASEASESEYSS